MLQWLIDEAVARGHSDLTVVERIMLINFAAIHTSSTACISLPISFGAGVLMLD